MADDGIFATTAEVQRKVGVNVSSVSNTEAFINQYMTEAESWINAKTGVNYSDTFTSLNVDKKGLLKMAASCMAAVDVISYDTSGIPAREAETRIDVLTDKYQKAISMLKQKKASDFVSAA